MHNYILLMIDISYLFIISYVNCIEYAFYNLTFYNMDLK